MDVSKLENNFLHSHSLFGGLTNVELEEIRHYFKEEHYRKGEIILHEAEPNSKLFFIVEGSVSILKDRRECMQGIKEDQKNEEPKNDENVIGEGSFKASPEEPEADDLVELNRMETGDTFGEMELIDIQPCAATVRAESDTTVVTFTNADLYQLSKWNLKTYSMIIMNLAREISRRLRVSNELLSLELYHHES
jgi:CRP/FNR family transcriptional regulator, cyclic AMP receptor protein